MANGVTYCLRGPVNGKLGICLCNGTCCDPDNPPDKHCQNHFFGCHRKCGTAARSRRGS
jgi:hypothetical protein